MELRLKFHRLHVFLYGRYKLNLIPHRGASYVFIFSTCGSQFNHIFLLYTGWFLLFSNPSAPAESREKRRKSPLALCVMLFLIWKWSRGRERTNLANCENAHRARDKSSLAIGCALTAGGRVEDDERKWRKERVSVSDSVSCVCAGISLLLLHTFVLGMTVKANSDSSSFRDMHTDCSIGSSETRPSI
jgi:hypothetical protein